MSLLVCSQSESPSRKRRRISPNGAVSGIEVRETSPISPPPPLHTSLPSIPSMPSLPTPPPWEFPPAPQRRSPRNHMSTRGSPTIRSRYQRYTDSFGLSHPFLPGHNPHPTIHNSHHGIHNSHHNIHNSHHNLHNSHHNMHNAHQTHPHHPAGTEHHPAQGANGPVVVDVGQVGVSGLGVAVSGEPLWHPQATGYRIPCQLHGIYAPTGAHAFPHSCQVKMSSIVEQWYDGWSLLMSVVFASSGHPSSRSLFTGPPDPPRSQPGWLDSRPGVQGISDANWRPCRRSSSRSRASAARPHYSLHCAPSTLATGAIKIVPYLIT